MALTIQLLQPTAAGMSGLDQILSSTGQQYVRTAQLHPTQLAEHRLACAVGAASSQRLPTWAPISPPFTVGFSSSALASLKLLRVTRARRLGRMPAMATAWGLAVTLEVMAICIMAGER